MAADRHVVSRRFGCQGGRILKGMGPSAKKVFEEALHLGESERAAIAGALIESLHGPAEPAAEEAWEREIERRVREIETGSVVTVPWSEVRARLFDGFE